MCSISVFALVDEDQLISNQQSLMTQTVLTLILIAIRGRERSVVAESSVAFVTLLLYIESQQMEYLSRKLAPLGLWGDVYSNQATDKGNVIRARSKKKSLI